MKFILKYNLSALSRSRFLIILFYISIVIFMGNVNALVDKWLHPEIPYFDTGHIIVGSITAMVTTVLYGALLAHLYHLRCAINTIKYMSSILPICASCKKIRKPEQDPRKMKSWQSIEMYLSEETKKSLTHGICPECLKKLYPEYSDLLKDDTTDASKDTEHKGYEHSFDTTEKKKS